MNIHIELLRLAERVATLEKKWEELEAAPPANEPDKQEAYKPADNMKRKAG